MKDVVSMGMANHGTCFLLLTSDQIRLGRYLLIPGCLAFDEWPHLSPGGLQEDGVYMPVC